ncbi:hypothetical protein CEXT_296811 [Caerostris extrusa]|uniref:Uncharacterized protein n=1 Tax=Caerostris extrusa TaxID=172846 RepID=A0AAV4S4U5_CAEEX|nr:hypothetical protein CEXT_296811 [Caerostris extrusa]
MAAVIRALPFIGIRCPKYKLPVLTVNINKSQVQFLRWENTSQQIPKLEEFDKPQFPGSQSNWTEKLEFVRGDIYDGIPVYRVMNRDGNIIDPSHDPKLDREMIPQDMIYGQYREADFGLLLTKNQVYMEA